LDSTVAPQVDWAAEAGWQADWVDIAQAEVERAFARWRFAEQRAQNDAIAAKLDAIGKPDMAYDVRQCFRHGLLEIYLGSRTHRFRPDEACHYPKFCSFHARRESRRRLARYVGPVMAAVAAGMKVRLVTLTVPNVAPKDLADTVAALWARWGAMRRQKWAEPMAGALASLEVTWNRRTATFHPHLHVLVLGPKTWDVNQATWAEAWGLGFVWVSRPKGPKGAVREVVKYLAPFAGKAKGHRGGLADVPVEPDADGVSPFGVFFDVVHGRRHFRSYGVLYDVAGESDESESGTGPEGGQEPDMVWRWGPGGADSRQVWVRLVHLKHTHKSAWGGDESSAEGLSMEGLRGALAGDGGP